MGAGVEDGVPNMKGEGNRKRRVKERKRKPKRSWCRKMEDKRRMG